MDAKGRGKGWNTKAIDDPIESTEGFAGERGSYGGERGNARYHDTGSSEVSDDEIRRIAA